MEKQYEVLFILGAGASKPYGFPTGDELVLEIQESCIKKTGVIYGHLKDQFHPRAIETFGTELRDSTQVSIDSFLKNRTEFDEAGKKAIVAKILKCESNVPAFYPREGNWIKYLINDFIGKNKSDWIKAKLNFITFNYDRSLEYILFRSIQSSFGLDLEQSKQIFQKFYIHHFYGSIGNLPFQENYNNASEYVPIPVQKKEWEGHYVSKNFKNIKVMWDERENHDGPDAGLLDYFYLSKKIFILGFGFDEFNLQRLGVDWAKITGDIYASSYQQSETERKRIIHRLGREIEFVEGDCLKLLKEKLYKL